MLYKATFLHRKNNTEDFVTISTVIHLENHTTDKVSILYAIKKKGYKIISNPKIQSFQSLKKELRANHFKSEFDRYLAQGIINSQQLDFALAELKNLVNTHASPIEIIEKIKKFDLKLGYDLMEDFKNTISTFIHICRKGKANFELTIVKGDNKDLYEFKSGNLRIKGLKTGKFRTHWDLEYLIDSKFMYLNESKFVTKSQFYENLFVKVFGKVEFFLSNFSSYDSKGVYSDDYKVYINSEYHFKKSKELWSNLSKLERVKAIAQNKEVSKVFKINDL